MPRKKLLIASTSTVYGGQYLDYLTDEMTDFFSGIDTVLFIPYARPSGISHDEYTETAQRGFSKIDKKIMGIHTFDNPKEAIGNAQAIFTGGGNTFLLIKQLYEFDLIDVLRKTVLNGTPYMGTSAGSNIAGQTIQTTNDMPIVYPPSFEALKLLPFNLNPHYLDPIPELRHMGETRETRIKEFHSQNDIPVVGLREGSWLRLQNEQIILKGNLTARIFEAEKEPYELEAGKIIL
ncbi:MAG: dipeptidase PepE [Capnocytophaga sp.]|nr:dipeptidase PepE [Capnocytophaga sp.]